MEQIPADPTRTRGTDGRGPLGPALLHGARRASVRLGRVGAAGRADRPRRQGLVRAARTSSSRSRGRRTPPTSSPRSTSAASSARPTREHSVKQMIGRVSRARSPTGAASAATSPPTRTPTTFEAELTHILLHQMAAFNSPVWFNVGFEESPQCSACFILSRRGHDGVDPRVEHQGGDDLPRRLGLGDQPVEDPRLDGAAGQGRHRLRAG